MAEFYERLSLLREEKGLNKTEMAKRLGIPVSTYSNYEYGNREPDFTLAKKIADYFNVTTDYLLGRPEKKDDDTKSNDIDDLDKMIDNARSFGGKKMTENDREIIKAYLKGFYDNKNQRK